MCSEADGHWLAGLVDGEGCFSLITRVRVDSQRTRKQVDWRFALALRADDAVVLEHAREVMGGIGTLSGKRHLNPGCDRKPVFAFSVPFPTISLSR